MRGYPSPRPFVGSKMDTPAGRPGKKESGLKALPQQGRGLKALLRVLQ